MSFEGYYQVLCEFGHANDADAYWGYEKTCNHKGCSGKIVWVNLVDETNYDTVGEVELEVEHEAIYETCDRCGYKKLIENTRYKIPTKE